MPYAIITRDKPNSLQLRNDTRGPHLEYLTANQDKLLAAGAQVDDSGQGGYGGIIILDTEDRAEAEAFIQGDPFTKAGLFSGIEVVRWRKAFFNKERLI
ncbi:MAG TPA: YciI family protein [Geminicoccaceae bacterium]|nr:YciI family protein [Geminicoccaceae bacterium]